MVKAIGKLGGSGGAAPMPRQAPRLLLAILLAGCAAAPGLLPPPAAAAGPGVVVGPDGSFAMEVPVRVFLVGFAPDVAAGLSARLTTLDVHHSHASYLSTLEPDRPDAPMSDTGLDYYAMPGAFTARFHVVDLDAPFAERFFGGVAASPLGDGLYDANAAEADLAAMLSEGGFLLDEGLNSLVLLHAGDALPQGHGWRRAYPHGDLAPIRYFGERDASIAVFDASARADPWVQGERPAGSWPWLFQLVEPTATQAYDEPLAREGAATVDALANLTLDVTNRRLLHGALYPVSTRPCHHIVVTAAVHEHSLSEITGRAATELLDVDEARTALRNLTGMDVRVDVRELRLPHDDPTLDAHLRVTATPVGALAKPFRGIDALRAHVHDRWDEFAGPADGCERYVVLYYFPDAAQEVRTIGGMSTFDVREQKRFAYAITNDVARLRAETLGPEIHWPTVNLVHEVGHLLGVQHPDVYQPAQGSARDIHYTPLIGSFQSGWTSASYQTGDRLADYGALDGNNWARNRAGYAVFRAHALGLGETPEFAAALDALSRYAWDDAHAALALLLEDAERLHSPGPRIP